MNRRPPHPQCGALPGCATLRKEAQSYRKQPCFQGFLVSGTGQLHLNSLDIRCYYLRNNVFQSYRVKNVSSVIIFHMNHHFSQLSDPRIERTKAYNLVDLVILCICAVICGADDWVSIAKFAESKKAWWNRWGLFSDRTPSHDTLGRVFSLIDSDQFAQLFTDWVVSISDLSQSKIVAIDGKTLRKSFDNKTGQSAIHMVSAWCVTNQLVFGQTKVDAKSNEITAIPKLLSMLDIRGCIILDSAVGHA